MLCVCKGRLQGILLHASSVSYVALFRVAAAVDCCPFQLYQGLFRLVADPLTNQPVGGDVLLLPGLSSGSSSSNSELLSCCMREGVFPSTVAASSSSSSSMTNAFLAGCLSLNVKTRETAARGLELLLLHAETQHLKPLGIKITGPLIRCVADKLPVSVKSALLRALR